MSLINDALKQARKAPLRQTPNNGLPLLSPVEPSGSEGKWLLPVLIGLFLLVGLGFIGWFVVHRQGQPRAVKPASATKLVAEVPPSVVAPPMPKVISQAAPSTAVAPVAPPPPVAPAAPVTPVAPAAPPPLPANLKLVLQGILYSRTAPSAIINGKTVHPGDELEQCHIKTIDPDGVTLTGPDGQEIKLNLGR
jgi:hypothetical protein